MEKRHLAMYVWLCEDKLKGKQLTSGCRQRLKNASA